MATAEDWADYNRQVYRDLGVRPSLRDLEAELRWQDEAAVYKAQRDYYNWRGVCKGKDCTNETREPEPDYCSIECEYGLTTEELFGTIEE